MKKKKFPFFTCAFFIPAAIFMGWIFLPKYFNPPAADSSPSPGSGHGDGKNNPVHEEEKDHAAAGCNDNKEDGKKCLSMEEILSKQCEHNRPAYQCETCRFEVGVVRIDPALLQKNSGSKRALLQTLTVSKMTRKNTLRVTGEVQLNENTAVHISPRIPGVIRSVNVDMGAEVKAEDTLFEIDSVELGKARSEYEKNRALAELSRKNFEREKALFERKISSEREMIAAQMAYETYKTELHAAEQKLLVLGLSKEDIHATANKVRRPAGRLPTRAPLDGTVIEKHAVTGELVEPGASVMLVADLRTVWVWANIYEQDLAPLLSKKSHNPVPAEVFVHAFPGQAFRGTIDYIGATMDEPTRTVKVRATLDNEEKLLRPGMFCEVQIVLAEAEEVMAIPKAALLSGEDSPWVFKHLEDSYYARCAVKRGRIFDGSVEVLEGLEPGETIIVGGAFLLKSDVLRKKLGAG